MKSLHGKNRKGGGRKLFVTGDKETGQHVHQPQAVTHIPQLVC